MNNNNKQSYILQAFIETPWAIMPSQLAALEEIVMRHVNGEKLDADEIQARISIANPRPQQQKMNSVAVLPLFGTIFPRADLFEEISGGTSAERFGAQFMELVKDPSISAIVIDVDSPGGSAYGVAEAAQKIFNARGTKPIVAVANHQMASAAYWIGSAADELVVTPSGDVGSIGVFGAHRDISAALEKQGIKVSLISAGKYKVTGNPFQALDEDARSFIQASVNEVYEEFVDAVAQNRGVKSALVKDSFGEGGMVGARRAVELGMADRVETLDETIERLLGNIGSSQNTFKANNPSALLNAADDGNTSKTSDDGQEPVAVGFRSEEAQVRRYNANVNKLENAKQIANGVTTMNMRQVLKNRDVAVKRAQELLDLTDTEERDFSAEEQAEFDACVTDAEELGVKIEKDQADRERVKALAEKKFATNEPEKPAPGNTDAKKMKRADYDVLHPSAQAAFIKSGGRLED